MVDTTSTTPAQPGSGKDITLEQAEKVRAVFYQGADRSARIPLTPMLSKSGNVYWGIPQSKGVYGVGVNAPQGFTDLPDRVELESVNGTKVGTEAITLKREQTEDFRPKVSGGKRVTVPQTSGADIERTLQVNISLRKKGGWNLKVSAIGGGVEMLDLFE